MPTWMRVKFGIYLKHVRDIHPGCAGPNQVLCYMCQKPLDHNSFVYRKIIHNGGRGIKFYCTDCYKAMWR